MVMVPEPLLVVVIAVPAAIVNVPPWEILELEPEVAAAVKRVEPLTKQVAQVRVNEPPRETAPPPPKGDEVLTVIDELAKSTLATDPSTMEVELTEAVVMRPEEFTANKSVLAALFWAWIR